MPSIDPKDIEVLKPILITQRMGGFARQAAMNRFVHPHHLLGGIVDFDAVPLTRAVLKGWLSGIAGDEGINDVNAPHKIKALGIEVETIKSSSSADYSELIESRPYRAMVMSNPSRNPSKGNDPRIVEVDGRFIEVRPVDVLLVVRAPTSLASSGS